MADAAWIEEARQEIKRRQAADALPAPMPEVAPDDLVAWGRLCGWIARHPRKYLDDGDLPPDVRALIGPAGATTRARWRAANLMPLYQHPRYGWRLAQDWEARLAQLGTVSRVAE